MKFKKKLTDLASLFQLVDPLTNKILNRFYLNLPKLMLGLEYKWYYIVNFPGANIDDKSIPYNRELFFNNLNDRNCLTLGLVLLKESKKKTEDKLISLTNDIVSNCNNSYELKLFNVGKYYEIVIIDDKTTISFYDLDIVNNKIVKSNNKPFIISIRGINKIKFSHGDIWRSLTLSTLSWLDRSLNGYLASLDGINVSENNFILNLLVNCFILDDNNEFMKDIIYNEYFTNNIKSLPKISLKDTRNISSRKKLFFKLYGFYYKAFNNLSWKDTIVISNLLKYIPENIHINIVRYFKNSYTPFDGVNEVDILINWYQSKFRILDYSLVRDYYRMIIELDLFLNINISSLKRLKIEHDKLVKELNFKNIIHKPLNIDHKYEKLNLPFSIITTNEDLYLEGIKQKHCVGIYYDYINSGKCAIYTDTYQDLDYTLEVNIIDNKPILIQCRGKFNNLPPKKYIDKVSKYLTIHEKIYNMF